MLFVNQISDTAKKNSARRIGTGCREYLMESGMLLEILIYVYRFLHGINGGNSHAFVPP